MNAPGPPSPRPSGEDVETPPASDRQLRDLPPGDAAWDAAFEVLRQLRGHLDRDGFDRLHRAGVPQGLRFTAAFASDGACLGVAGWRTTPARHDAGPARRRLSAGWPRSTVRRPRGHPPG